MHWAKWARLVRRQRATSPILIADYPHDLRMRYGSLLPSHAGIAAILDRFTDRFVRNLTDFSGSDSALAHIPVRASNRDAEAISWDNGFFAPLDVICLYSLVIQRNPALYLEIGSGTSTKVVAMAKRDAKLRTRIVSIDPQPRQECDRLCDRIYRQPLERADLSLFDDVQAGDIVFFDGSHRVLQNSDTTVFLLDVLPRLPRGVLVHQHDIFWPEDYPQQWADRLYSEQYALALLLLFKADLRIVMANAHVTRTLSPSRYFPKVAERLREQRSAMPIEGCSFWYEV